MVDIPIAEEVVHPELVSAVEVSLLCEIDELAGEDE